MPDPPAACWVTLASDPAELSAATLMIASLRTFGGAIGDCPVLLYLAGPQLEIDRLPGIETILLDPPGWTKAIPFGAMAYACAQAERWTSTWCKTLVWIAAQMSWRLSPGRTVFPILSKSGISRQPGHCLPGWSKGLKGCGATIYKGKRP
jgi:hypothetical protein